MSDPEVGGVNTPEQQVLLDKLWGFGDSQLGGRWPLPTTGRFVTHARSAGLIAGVSHLWHPPYIVAWRRCDGIEVMLCEGDGYRAGYDREHGVASACVYADSEDMPEEWKEPVAKALAEIRAKWPGVPLVFRPDTDGEML